MRPRSYLCFIARAHQDLVKHPSTGSSHRSCQKVATHRCVILPIKAHFLHTGAEALLTLAQVVDSALDQYTGFLISVFLGYTAAFLIAALSKQDMALKLYFCCIFSVLTL